MHVRQLNARRDALQNRAFSSLRFFDEVTDLTVGLAPDHQWVGGSIVAANGVEGLRSLPCEELFTALDGRTARGRVRFSRPIALGGAIVRDLYAEFENGAVTMIKADSGAEFFDRLLGDADGRRLGEVGLVPASSPVTRAGVPFWNPLLDRNGASHLAFGRAPAACYRAGHAPRMSDSSHSSIHIDCMLGHERMHVDGLTHGGEIVPIMRNGEFVT
jgi:aminopeptidase